MIPRIKLSSVFIHPSEDIKDHPLIKDFEATISFAKDLGIGTYCLYAKTEQKTRLISFSSDEGMTMNLPRNRWCLTWCEQLVCTLGTCAIAASALLVRTEANAT